MVHQNLILVIIGLYCTIRCGITASVCRSNGVFSIFELQKEVTYQSGMKSPELQFGNECRCALKQSFLEKTNSCIKVLNCLDICAPNAHHCRCSTNYDYQTEVENSGTTALSFIEKCQPICACNKGYVWDHYDKNCITIALYELSRKRFDFGIG